jgi:spermidine synthase
MAGAGGRCYASGRGTYLAMPVSGRTAPSAVLDGGRSNLVPACVFFISGFPALIYQLTWQRALFTIYGINVEAVTVVVTGFLLGLGLGSMAGGAVSKRASVDLLAVFGAIELGIACVGVVSLPVLAAVGARTLALPTAATTAITLLLLVLPTLLMGSTLPILVAYLVRRSGNVGSSVGLLYFLNTLGSSVACFAVAIWLMGALGMQGAVNLAAVLNLGVGAGALFEAWRNRRRGGLKRAPERRVEVRAIDTPTWRFRVALAVAALSGFISLSYEIVWFRAFALATGTASAFALILGAFLAGIAFGSLAARGYCDRGSAGERGVIRAVAGLTLASSLLGFALLPLAGFAALHGWALAGMLLLVVLQTALLGAVFPLVAHFGIAPDRRAGAKLSQAYFANILGSAAGALLTGFVLMDHLTLAQISVLLAVLGLLLGLALLPPARLGLRWLSVGVAVGASGLVLVPLLAAPMFDRFYERITFKAEAPKQPSFSEVVETKSGVVTVTPDGMVFGGGYYDGRIEVDLLQDRNLLVRPLALSAFHPRPRDVLVIGLATGAWTQLLLANPAVERVTVVEINPGYLEIIRRHGNVASLLGNPKLRIVIDDGRRWLNRHRDERFDAVVQNTTWHVRANVTNLLSAEYLALVARHLQRGGVFIYNTTHSARAQRTACLLFPDSVRYLSAMAVGRERLPLDPARLDALLDTYAVDGKLLFDMSDPSQRERRRQIIAGMALPPPGSQGVDSIMEACPSILARTAGLRPVTDDNMGEEWFAAP